MDGVAGGLGFIGLVIGVVLLIWVILSFMIPFHINSMKKDLATIREHLTKRQVRVVWEQPEQYVDNHVVQTNDSDPWKNQ